MLAWIQFSRIMNNIMKKICSGSSFISKNVNCLCVCLTNSLILKGWGNIFKLGRAFAKVDDANNSNMSVRDASNPVAYLIKK